MIVGRLVVFYIESLFRKNMCPTENDIEQLSGLQVNSSL